MDARKKKDIGFIYIIDIVLKDERKIKAKSRDISISSIPVNKHWPPQSGINPLSLPPVVIGAGPAGLFAALFLAKYGYRPVLLEQGKDVDHRIEDVEKFFKTGALEQDSNVQFGEGGAGTFSDGKLTARTKDPLSNTVLEELVALGADPQILFWYKPHIGSDCLIKIIKNLRHKIIDSGGRIAFSTKVEELNFQDSKLSSAKINNCESLLPLEVSVLAPGHSARDTYLMLERKGVAICSKPFAIGLRIEHEQSYIDSLQYGIYRGHPLLGAADYRLAWKDEINSRGVYTFCMCPGGYVVNAASETGGVVTNGMSNALRDSGIANSAIVVTVKPADFGFNPLDGINWQRHWESKAFSAGGSDYSLPCQMAEDFMNNRTGEIKSGFKPLAKGIKSADLRRCLPDIVTDSMLKALDIWQRQMKDFIKEPAVLSGVETRTSAPLRILRGEGLESVNRAGLYLAGEGSGYSGGIVSSAIDGIKAAYAIINKYAKPLGDFPDQVLEHIIRES